MYSKERIYQLIDKALVCAAGHPAKVEIADSAEGLSRIANSEIHQNVYEEKTTLTVFIYGLRKVSSIATNILSDEGIAAAVGEAIANLELLPDGEEQPELVNSPAEMETLRFNQELHDSFGVQTRVKLIAEGLQRIDAPYRAFGQLSYQVLSRGMGNSAGIRRFSSSNQARFNLLIADDLGGTGFAVQTASSPQEMDVAAVFDLAFRKAKANRDPIEIEPGAYTVILEPAAVSDLALNVFLQGFSGTLVNSKMSFLADRIGEKLFSEKLTVVDDWENPLVLGDAFDSEGMPRRKLTLVENGVTKDVAYDQVSAKRAGVEPTGHELSVMGMRIAAPVNVIIAGGEKPLAQIIAETDKALLVSRFHYMNTVNPRQAQLTGITRDGFFLVENGQITHAVRNMRFTESMLKAFNQIEEISSDRAGLAMLFAAMSLPAMKISDFHFTGKTSFTDA